jgi:hypothetical protein
MSNKLRKSQKKQKAPIARMDTIKYLAMELNKTKYVLNQLILYLQEKRIIEDDKTIIIPTAQEVQKVQKTVIEEKT